MGTLLFKKIEEIKNEIYSSVTRAMKREQFILGDEVGCFEKELSSYLGANYVVGVNTGTDALFYSLKVLGIGADDEVMTTPFSFSSTADAIVMAGAKPVFVDIEPNSFNIDASKIEKKITSRTKAIIPVHLYGQSADMERILRIAKKHNLKIIEDAAQSLGSKYKDKFLGTLGDLGCLSFYPTKILGAFGDGGAIVTASSKLVETLRLMRIHGAKKMYYDYAFIGGSSRLHVLQAAVLRTKLKYLDWFIERRREIADIYYQQLGNLSFIKLPYQNRDSFHGFNYFTIRVTKGRNQLYEYLRDCGIPVAIIYPVPIHLLSPYKFLGYRIGDFPEAEKASREVLCLPTNPEMDTEIPTKIISAIKIFLKKNGEISEKTYL